jgi:hypothetical protein
MSHSTGKVYKEDGTFIGYVEVNGTCEPPVCLPNIFVIKQKLEDNWRKQEWNSCNCRTVPVVIQEDFTWSEHCWKGSACLDHMLVISGHSPSDDYDERTHKLPFEVKE